MNQDDNSKSDGQSEEQGGTAKILPFRRAPTQPTLPRRAAGSAQAQFRAKVSGTQNQGAAWKGKALQLLQLAVLALAVFLALKNCGKI